MDSALESKFADGGVTGMMDDFGPLVTDLRRIFPNHHLEPIGESEVVAIRQRYPDVPEDYLSFLRQVGYGSLGGTFMIYSGPVEPDEIFDPRTAADLPGLLFFGDDFSGRVVGFDTRHGWRLVGVDNGCRESDPEDARTVAEFITRRLADQEGPDTQGE
jgi:hypothetical protein